MINNVDLLELDLIKTTIAEMLQSCRDACQFIETLSDVNKYNI